MSIREKIKRRDYPLYYDCIVTDQVDAKAIADLFKDKGFKNYWKKRKEEQDRIYGKNNCIKQL